MTDSGLTFAGHTMAAPAPVPLLFLCADTGGGHRSAATAVGQALERAYPGRFAPVLCDPLGGPGAPPALRRMAALYGPVIRLAPWLWGAAYHLTNSRPAMALLDAVLLRLAGRTVARQVATVRPAAIVSFHPLTGLAAVRARGRGGAARVPVVTVITDLGAAHVAWRYAAADLVIAPPPATSGVQAGTAAAPGVRAGPPVGSGFWAGPASPGERASLRRSLGLGHGKLLVMLVGGGEGCGGIGRRATAIVRRFADVDVVAVCGRNTRLRQRLDRLAARAGGRLTVTGFAANLPDLLRCADLVVTKAGPGTITEATCCGAPLLLTSHLPGQERGNAELVCSAGAGRRAASVRRLVAEVGRLRDDPAAVAGLRAASARLARPGDTHAIAVQITGLAAPAGQAVSGSGRG